MNIVEFLEARITEDERAARNASPGPWTFSNIASVGGGTIYDPTVAVANVEWDNEHVDPRIRRTRPDWQADATGKHIATHNPARVLAECAAKRAIIRVARSGYPNKVGWYEKKNILEALAAVYHDHPDYQQEWSDAT